jgi:Na+/alanine symporter
MELLESFFGAIGDLTWGWAQYFLTAAILLFAFSSIIYNY